MKYRICVYAVFLIASCLLLSAQAKAQYVNLTSSIVYDPVTKKVTGTSRTEMDYQTRLYYDVAYVQGKIFRQGDSTALNTVEDYTRNQFQDGYYYNYTDRVAIATTQAEAMPYNTDYRLTSNHQLLGILVLNYNYRNDLFNYSLLSPNNYGDQQTLYGGCCGVSMPNVYINFGTTTKTVHTTNIDVNITNPRVNNASIGNTTKNALIAANLTLQAKITPGAEANDTYSWDIGQPSTVVGGSVTSPSVTVRFYQAGTYTARLTHTRGTYSQSIPITINVVEPALTNFQSQILSPPSVGFHFAISPNQLGPLYFMLGSQSYNGKTEGISFNATVSSPSYISEDGRIKFVQIGKSDTTQQKGTNKKCSGTNGAWIRDADPYPINDNGINGGTSQALPSKPTVSGGSVTARTFDTPGVTLYGYRDSFFDTVTTNFDFETYVVYFADDKQIGLGYYIPWHYDGRIERDLSDPVYGYRIVSRSPINTPLYQSSTPTNPMWNSTNRVRPFDSSRDLNSLPYLSCR